MATITHQLANGNVRSNFLGGQTGISYLSATVDLTADQVAQDNVIEFFRLPADAIIVDGYLKVDELDADTSLTIDIGHDGNADAFTSAPLTTGQTGGTVQFTTGTPLLPRDPTDPTTNDNDPFSPAEEGTVISATFPAGPGTAQAGKISLIIGLITAPNH